MMVRHILKDGTVVQDITGHTVRRKEAETVYLLLERINERKGNGRLRRHQESK